MDSDIWIPDANIFLEYIYGRKHANQSKKLLTNAIQNKIQLIAPSLMLDEITEVLCGNLNNINEIRSHLNYLEQLSKQEVLFIVVPNTETRMKAVNIARIGHIKSGYPEYTDSLYHALAILNNGTFITNDEKHYSKVKKLGHIYKLSDY